MTIVISLIKGSQLWWCDLMPIWKDSCVPSRHSLEWSICSVYPFEVDLDEQFLPTQKMDLT